MNTNDLVTGRTYAVQRTGVDFGVFPAKLLCKEYRNVKGMQTQHQMEVIAGTERGQTVEVISRHIIREWTKEDEENHTARLHDLEMETYRRKLVVEQERANIDEAKAFGEEMAALCETIGISSARSNITRVYGTTPTLYDPVLTISTRDDLMKLKLLLEQKLKQSFARILQTEED